MPEKRRPVRVAINVMRARLTVIGFNIAIVSFQIAQLRSGNTVGGLYVPGIGHTLHVVADMELFISLGLSLIAMLALIMSSEFDEVGQCTHWSLVAGCLLMYMALGHTVAGFFSPLSTTIETVAGKMPNQAPDFQILQSGSRITGGAAWFLATYVGPLVTLLRSPFSRRSNIALGSAYLLVLLVLSWNMALAVRVESAVSGDGPGLVFGILRELVQPLRW